MFGGLFGKKEPEKPFKVDSSLPIIKSIQTISDMNAVAFEWIPLSDNPKIAGYKIYRIEGNERNSSQKLINVATLKDRTISHYTDINLQPNSFYQYRFTAFTKDRQESEGSRTVKARTLPKIRAIDYIIPVGNLANKVKLLWRPHPSQRVSGYIVERSSIYNPKWIEIARVPNRLSVEYIDYNLENDRVYKYRLRVSTFDGIVSAPSKVVQAETKEPPKSLDRIETTFNLPKQIKISWSAGHQKNIMFRIYRSFEHNGKFELIRETKDHSYTDKLNRDGFRAFYKVSVVDEDGLESPLHDSEPTDGVTLKKPMKPKLERIISSESDITLYWTPADSRSFQYKIIRKKKSGWITIETKEFLTKETKFVDRDVVKGDVYSYQVVSIDQFGITSKPTEESEKSLRE
jgi:fibronectin type 3 domain-containing protein